MSRLDELSAAELQIELDALRHDIQSVQEALSRRVVPPGGDDNELAYLAFLRRAHCGFLNQIAIQKARKKP